VAAVVVAAVAGPERATGYEAGTSGSYQSGESDRSSRSHSQCVFVVGPRRVHLCKPSCSPRARGPDSVP
jgi:hypothetical protein